jgi:uncharacterized YceG family protein
VPSASADGRAAPTPPRTGRRVPPPRRPPPAARTASRASDAGRSRRWAGRVLSLLALALACALIWFLVELFQPLHGSGHGSVAVTIPPHSSASRIGDLLERKGVIASSFFFGLRAALAGDRGKLRAGTYDLRLDMSYGQVLSRLTRAPKAARVTELTIVEGRRRAEIASLLHHQGVLGSYLAATRRSRLLNPRSYGAPRRVASLEGFLFPSTYQLRAPIDVRALVADQLRTFKREFATVDLSYARRHRLSPYDVLIVASMIQGEAQTKRDLSLVASVIYNRLAEGMPLGLDATTRYATGNFHRPLTDSQLHSRSPYNTRVHVGLPPGPIDNPGLAAIEAAAHPARTNYLYFVVKACGNGAELFTSSYSQFLRDAQQYQSARSARGGRSPVQC